MLTDSATRAAAVRAVDLIVNSPIDPNPWLIDADHIDWQPLAADVTVFVENVATYIVTVNLVDGTTGIPHLTWGDIPVTN